MSTQAKLTKRRVAPNWEFLPQHQDRIQDLLILDDTPELLKHVLEAYSYETSALLVIPRALWDFKDPILAELIAKAARELRAENLLLAASPETANSNHQRGLEGSERLSSFSRQGRSPAKRFEEHFAAHLSDLAEIEVLPGFRLGEALQIKGALYDHQGAQGVEE